MEDPNTLRIELLKQEITFPGRIFPQRYNSFSDRANGHHFIVWSKGNNANKALIETDVPDENILAGLEALGAIPGNNLSAETWTERFDPNSSEPDKRVKGTRVEIWVSWNNTIVPAYELFQDIGKEQFDIHVGGHADLIPKWRSGCVVCMFSCPGGRMSNAAFTIRDQANDAMIFHAKEEGLPADGTKVTVRIRILDDIDQSESVSD